MYISYYRPCINYSIASQSCSEINRPDLTERLLRIDISIVSCYNMSLILQYILFSILFNYKNLKI